MEKYTGIGVSRGVAVGDVYIIESERMPVRRRTIPPERVDDEIARFHDAVAKAIEGIRDDQTRLTPRLGEEYLAIFESHVRLLDDKRLREGVEQRIRDEQMAAEAAVDDVLQKHVQLLFEDKSTARWVSDIYDIQSRLHRVLLGRSTGDLREMTGPAVIVAEDLTPSQTVSFERDRVLGIAMEAGGTTSHTAIIANALGIPAVVGLRGLTAEVRAGDRLVVDGGAGEVLVNPDQETLARYVRIEQDIVESDRRLLDEQAALPAETLDGWRATLYANIEFPREVQNALDNGAEGIGLYRTEYLYLEKGREPTEEEHFEAYRAAAEAMWPHPVVIRTFDLGADKAATAEGERATPEPNPFLGCRSIRLCFEREGMFKTQLRAILRASVYGYVRILLPMITSLQEIRRAREFVAEMHDELDAEGIRNERDVEVGAMIEVPSAAVQADSFAKEVDFFSIGTNDLIQYTLAVDRANPVVSHLFQPAHPAVIKLIKNTIDAGDAAGIPVAMCGQMSSDLSYLVLLLGLGLREFSTSPKVLPEVKRAIRMIKVEEAREVASSVIQEADATEALRILTAGRTELLQDE
ncbi:MAG: phosphoenolpyruvate--protein phosphotransferase [Planctomycetota bacterium]